MAYKKFQRSEMKIRYKVIPTSFDLACSWRAIELNRNMKAFFRKLCNDPSFLQEKSL